MVDESGAAHEEKDARLPDDHPHIQLFRKAVPVWHDTPLDELDEEIGAGYACGFSAGFERGIITALLKPEWAQGLYHRLRHYYLMTHTAEDLLDWDDHAEQTAQALPINFDLRAERRERWPESQSTSSEKGNRASFLAHQEG